MLEVGSFPGWMEAPVFEKGKPVLRTRGSGNLIWSTLTWSMSGTHMRLGSTMREAMMSMMASSDRELEAGWGGGILHREQEKKEPGAFLGKRT